MTIKDEFKVEAGGPSTVSDEDIKIESGSQSAADVVDEKMTAASEMDDSSASNNSGLVGLDVKSETGASGVPPTPPKPIAKKGENWPTEI